MWKIFNKLFGWDYIHWKNSADRGIARIHVDAEGIAYYWRYKNIDLMDRLDGTRTEITWLTCPPEKYKVNK
jgi:hypothetical protein